MKKIEKNNGYNASEIVALCNEIVDWIDMYELHKLGKDVHGYPIEPPRSCETCRWYNDRVIYDITSGGSLGKGCILLKGTMICINKDYKYWETR